jgi:hypothetical protein
MGEAVAKAGSKMASGPGWINPTRAGSVTRSTIFEASLRILMEIPIIRRIDATKIAMGRT